MPKKAAEVEMHCAKCQPGSKIAKDLGIYLGQLYGWVKAEKLENHKPDGKYVTSDGSGLWADPDQARAVWMASTKKSPRDPSKPRAKKGKVVSEDGTITDAPKVRRLKAGTIVSFENGKQAKAPHNGKGPSFTVAQVLGVNGHLTFLDDNKMRRHYDGTLIGDVVFGTERLSTMLAKGAAHIETPTSILGMVILSLILEGKVELAESLEKWMEKNDLPVNIPELMDIEEDPEPEPVRGAPVLTLTGADDDTE